MQLLYDITAQPVAWASIHLLWLIALIVVFFTSIVGLGDPGPPSETRKHRLVSFSWAAFAALIAVVGTAVGLMNRSSCIALANDDSSVSVVEGRIHDLKRGRRTMTHVRFGVDDVRFDTEPALFRGCGWVNTVADVARLTDGDYVQVSFDRERILKVRKRQP